MKKLTVLIVPAILLTLLSGLLFQKQTKHTLTNLGPLDDPICIETVVTDRGFPIAWQKGVVSCSENDAHSDVGVFNKGNLDFLAFATDTMVYLALLFLLLKVVPRKNKKHF